MKKIFIALAAIAVLASCNKEEAVKTITFTAKINTTETKVSLGTPQQVLGVDVYPVVWNASDKISVIADGMNAPVTFDLVSGAGTSTAKFGYTGSGITESMQNYKFSYPANIETVSTSQTYVEGSLPTNGVTLKAESAAFTQTPTFTKRSALVKVNVQGNGMVTNITIMVSEVVNNQSVSRPYTLNCGNGVPVDGSKEFYVGLNPNSLIESVQINVANPKPAPTNIVASQSTITTVNIAL